MPEISRRPFKGSKLVRGVDQTPGRSLRARSDASAQKGLYIDETDFGTLKSMVGDPKRANTKEERQRIAAALQTLRGEITKARDLVDATDLGRESTRTDILDVATEAIIFRAEQESPEQGAVLMATISNQIDQLQPATAEEERQVESMQKSVERTTSAIMKQLQQREAQLKRVAESGEQFQPAARRSLAFSGNPEIATAAPQLVQDGPPEASPRPAVADVSPPQVSPRPAAEESTPRSTAPAQPPQGSVLLGAFNRLTAWAQTQPEEELVQDVGIADGEVDDIVAAHLEDLDGEPGDDPKQDEELAEDIADSIVRLSEEYQDAEDGGEVAAGMLVSGVSYLSSLETEVHPEAQGAVRTQSGRLLDLLDQGPPSTVKRGYRDGFQTDQDATPRPREEREIDGLEHPHVSTAQAQHDETNRGTWLDSEEDEPEATRAAAGAVAAQAARQNKYTTVEKRRMDQLNPGSLGAPAVPLRTAAFVTKLTENLEEAPRVAALVQRGLLKTSDVLNPVYVQAMEKRLREQQITKEVEGRDARYRPRTARQAYRPPVNVVQTGQPGVYKYRRPRFAQPQISQPVQNS